MAELCAGMVKLPQSENVGPGRPKSTVTLSMLTAPLLRLSSRMAPASKVGPLPRNTMLGEPCQGTGKLGFERRLSAYPTETAKDPLGDDCSNSRLFASSAEERLIRAGVNPAGVAG